MPNSRPKPSLRQLLAVKLLALTLLSTLVIAVLGAKFLADQLRTDAEEHLREAALRVHDSMDSFLLMHQTCIRSLASRLAPAPGKPISVDLSRDVLEKTLPIYRGMLTMLVADRDGRIVRAVRRDQRSFTPSGDQDQSVADRPYFAQPQVTLNPYTSGVFQGRGLGSDPIVAISAPMLDSEGRFAGIVEASLDIRRSPLSLEFASQTLISLVYDGSGNIVHSLDSRAHPPLSNWPGLSLAAAASPRTLFRLKDSGKARYAVRLPLAQPGWNVVTLADVDEVEYEVRRFYAMVAIALAMLVFLAYQMANYVARTIANPVVALVGDIERFNAEQEVPKPATYDLKASELVQIHAVFRDMATRLHQSFRQLNDLLAGLDRKVAERTEQLAESEARYRQVIDTSGDIIYRVNARGRIEFHNPAFERALGLSAIGRRMGEFLAPVSRSEAISSVREQLKSNTPTVYLEIHVRRADGALRWLGQSTQILRNEAGAFIGFQAIARDITDRKLAEMALREAEERYALAVRGSNNGIWDWDVRNPTVYFSPRWRDMFGIPPEEEFETLDHWVMRVHPGDRQAFLVAITNFAVEDTAHLFEEVHRIHHADGTWRWALTCGAAVRDATGQALRIAGSTSDVTATKLKDALTGLPNRLAMVERLDRLVPQGQVAVLCLDLDRFKMINDSMGHVVGDELLFGVSRRLLTAVRQSAPDQATVGRLGGDEFVIIVRHEGNLRLPGMVAEAVLAEMVAPHHLQGSLVFVGTSIGIAGSESARNAEEILRNADTAMYQAKTEGRGRYCVFDSSMHARAVARLELDTDLRHAVEANEFLLHFQPQVDLRTGRLSGFEALVRWLHPRRGLVPPAEFIGLAEENGLILPIGRWVLEQGIRQLAEWDAQYPAAAGLSLSLNLSPRQFLDPALQGNIESFLEAARIAPRRIHLEITESMVAGDPAHAQAILRSLSALGVGLEIDDFGTGYSSLSQLHQLPFDTLKVDRSFVQALDACEPDQQEGGKIVESILNLSSSLGIHVVAEGIETEQHWTKLAQLGCEYGQGYYFSRPIPASEVPALMEYRAEHPWQMPDGVSQLALQLSQLGTELRRQQRAPAAQRR